MIRGGAKKRMAKAKLVSELNDTRLLRLREGTSVTAESLNGGRYHARAPRVTRRSDEKRKPDRLAERFELVRERVLERFPDGERLRNRLVADELGLREE